MFQQTRYPTISVSNALEAYDYIIVGGGTAGCVMANRLSNDPRVSVLVLERGGVKGGLLSSIPLLSSHFASDGSRSRVLRSTPQKHLDGRTLNLVSSNSLGGASKTNAMLYNRGIPAEYDLWRDAGRVGWGYDDMLRFFKLSETDLDQDPHNPSPYHGISGEWPNRSYKEPVWPHTPLVVRATAKLGLPYVEDLNDPSEPAFGCTKMHYTMDSNGRRSSTHTAFLPAHLVNSRRRSLHVCTPAVVQRIQVSPSDGEVGDAVAEGVWIQSGTGGASRFVRAKRQVILTAGPIYSPQVLMLSGIGPAEHLREHQVPVRKNLPGVGSHLQDHIAVPVQFCVPLGDSIMQLQHRPWLIVVVFFQWLLFGTGWLLSPIPELSIFVQSRLLDEQSHVVCQDDDKDASLAKNLPDIEVMVLSSAEPHKVKGGGFAFYTATLRPTSTGTVRLVSTDPCADPVVDPNYLANEDDRRVTRRAVRLALQLKRELVELGYPVSDGAVPAGPTDADVDAFIKSECMSAYHYSSTCRMAPESEGGVVDDRLRVHGVRNLRVADSSVFPSILSAHLAAPTVAVAEKCAEMIKDDDGSL